MYHPKRIDKDLEAEVRKYLKAAEGAIAHGDRKQARKLILQQMPQHLYHHLTKVMIDEFRELAVKLTTDPIGDSIELEGE